MLTSNDIKVKALEAGKLKRPITTNKTKPKEFKMKGKPVPPSKVIITTSNVEMYRKRYEKEMKGKKK